MTSTRRNFIKQTLLVGAGLNCGSIGFPNIVKGLRPKLRVLGTHVTLQEALRLRAEKDLGIDIEFIPGGSAQIIHQAVSAPETFDIYEQWSNSVKILWDANVVQPIEINKIERWNEVNSLTKTGRLLPESRIGRGDVPYKMLYVDADEQLSEHASGNISFLPYVHNVDSFGYDSRFIEPGIPYETESWGWLLDRQYSGKVAIINEPTIGLFDLALAVEAQGLMSFADIGNMTRTEIDRFFDILIDYRIKGHFRGFWSSVPHSVQLMQKKEAYIQSMFSPGVSTLNGLGIPCIYAAPKEGYRAWHGVMCLSAKTTGDSMDAAYRYMNWWLSGWPGAFIARQGYYISNPERSRPHLAKAEWDYWYDGKPAVENLKGTDGRVSVKMGDIRRGGSYEKRFSNITVWNSVMNQYEYTLSRWNQLLIS